MAEDNEFTRWRAIMGYSVGEAAEKLGMKLTTATSVSQGRRSLRDVERLAMAALRSDLPPWSAKRDAEISATLHLRLAFQGMQISRRIAASLETSASSLPQS